MKYGTYFQHNFREVKVRVQGQNCHAENIPIVIRLRYLHQIWQSGYQK